MLYYFRRYRRALEVRLLEVCPYQEGERRRLAKELVRNAVLLSLLSALLLLFWNCRVQKGVTFYGLLCSGFLGWLLLWEIPDRRLQRKEERLFRQMLDYLREVKQRFFAGRNIPNAVFDSAREQSYEIRLHAAQLYGLLTDTRREHHVRNYISTARNNKFWKLFLVQCYETSEKGDILLSEGNSLFAENIEQIRLELMSELHRRKKRGHLFAGYLFVTVAPFLSLSVLQSWGIRFSAELRTFYQGPGRLIAAVCFVTTVLLVRYIKKHARFGGSVSETVSEIQQFQTILWMERRFPEMTRLTLLEDMEAFSMRFRPILRECLNNYSAGPEQALRRMREQGGRFHAAFAEIAECFLMVEEVGVEMAFAGMENSRQMLEREELFLAELQMENGKDRTELLSKFPSVLAVGAYFAVPFLLSAIQGVWEVFTILEGL